MRLLSVILVGALLAGCDNQLSERVADIASKCPQYAMVEIKGTVGRSSSLSVTCTYSKE